MDYADNIKNLYSFAKTVQGMFGDIWKLMHAHEIKYLQKIN